LCNINSLHENLEFSFEFGIMHGISFFHMKIPSTEVVCFRFQLRIHFHYLYEEAAAASFLA